MNHPYEPHKKDQSPRTLVFLARCGSHLFKRKAAIFILNRQVHYSLFTLSLCFIYTFMLFFNYPLELNVGRRYANQG